MDDDEDVKHSNDKNEEITEDTRIKSKSILEFLNADKDLLALSDNSEDDLMEEDENVEMSNRVLNISDSDEDFVSLNYETEEKTRKNEYQSTQVEDSDDKEE